MKTVVVMPGGFHPFHAGHMALYNQIRQEFPDADVYVAATNDTSTRPFPFELKEKLARLAGVEPGHFVQVRSPFQPKEITAKYPPADTVLIFARSEKDRNEPPRPGAVKKDGTAGYLQLLNDEPETMDHHAYMTYLPTVKFGPGLTSATEIRSAWPGLTDRRKTALVMSLYPRTQTNTALARTVVQMLDQAIGSDADVQESRDYLDEKQ
jgi:cytidyltransferase-like protein